MKNIFSILALTFLGFACGVEKNESSDLMGVGNREIILQAQSSGKCMVGNNLKAVGGERHSMAQYSCKNIYTDSKFITKKIIGDVYSVRQKSSKLCLTHLDNGKVVMGNCNEKSTRQQILFFPAPGKKGYYNLAFKADSKSCLTIKGASGKDDARAIVQKCAGLKHQAFKLQ